MRYRQYVTGLHAALAGSKKIVFLGFDLDPRYARFPFMRDYAPLLES